ncbi:Arm DNA-binding domain-containing protein [Falsihalocynthiibacter arcticus]|uniref:Arm DNA-binding domain-containing protein n=1 Tax=Falsihalocynthiibacter arcticus TaxID=1579316 RepID=UPI003AABAAD3
MAEGASVTLPSFCIQSTKSRAPAPGTRAVIWFGNVALCCAVCEPVGGINKDHDVTGLRLRAYASGKRRWSFLSRIRGTNTRRTVDLGDGKLMLLSKARDVGRKLRNDFSQGIDTIGEA